MRTLLTTGSLLSLLTMTALAADVTGKWVAEVAGRGGQTHEVTFNFKADGATLTGTISGPRGEMKIAEGKIDGGQISFAEVMDLNGNQVKILYKGTVVGNQITFTRSREGGPGGPGGSQGGGQGRKGQGGGPQQFTARRAS
ncbi:MAG: hypothetical protein ABSH32_02075 [Bryobacteraceae bacterium]|jgi:hypothetical protein